MFSFFKKKKNITKNKIEFLISNIKKTHESKIKKDVDIINKELKKYNMCLTLEINWYFNEIDSE